MIRKTNTTSLCAVSFSLCFSALLVLSSLCAMSGVYAEDEDEDAVERVGGIWDLGLPTAMLADAMAVVSVNDPLAVISTLNAGVEVGVLWEEPLHVLAHKIYFSRDMSGIDMNRSMVVLWRTGRLGVSAIIPLNDIQVFLNNFVRIRMTDGIMVRIGEKDGTTVFRQNSPFGMLEYRLLIRDRTAYFSRSKRDCELLAETKLVRREDAPFISMHVVKPYEFLPHFERFVRAGESNMVTALRSMILNEYDKMLRQVAGLELTAQVVNKHLRLACLVHLEDESDLKTWTLRQQNQRSRLLPVMDTANAVLAVHGSIDWLGNIKQAGYNIIDIIDAEHKRQQEHTADAAHAEGAPEENTPSSVEKMLTALTGWCAIADRQGAFAYTLHVQAQSEGLLDVQQQTISEQTRAEELCEQQQTIEQYILTHAKKSERAIGFPVWQQMGLHSEALQVSPLMPMTTYQGYWIESKKGVEQERIEAAERRAAGTEATQNQSPDIKKLSDLNAKRNWTDLRQLRMASNDFAMHTLSFGTRESIESRAVATMEQLHVTTAAPTGVPGILVAHVNLHHVLREVSNLAGGIGYNIPVAEITADITLNEQDHVLCRVDIPIDDVVQAMSASDWTTFTDSIQLLFSESE